MLKKHDYSPADGRMRPQKIPVVRYDRDKCKPPQDRIVPGHHTGISPELQEADAHKDPVAVGVRDRAAFERLSEGQMCSPLARWSVPFPAYVSMNYDSARLTRSIRTSA